MTAAKDTYLKKISLPAFFERKRFAGCMQPAEFFL